MNQTKRPVVAIIGDGDMPRNDQRYDMAYRLGDALMAAGYRIITGGRSGIMQGVSQGARESASYKEGSIMACLPSNNPLDANRYADISIATGLGIARNVVIAHADAVIAIGGGAGTLSEMAMAWSLKRLIIAYRVDGWSGKLADQPIDHRQRYANIPKDRVYGVEDAMQAITALQTYLPLYTASGTGVE
ncbi:MAG: TIGR00725 family protein [Oceanospirillaceae bacterium]|nr:TIGR00725 family protein [Oceanospirillaceae bacterium]